jgi:cold-inducible RNA-binding protein
MGAKVYVGNLPFSVYEGQLRSLVEEDGRQVVGVNIVTDRFTGRSRRFSFVDMANPQESAAIIKALNGRNVGGCTLMVSIAREEGPRRGGFGGGRGGRRQDTY